MHFIRAQATYGIVVYDLDNYVWHDYEWMLERAHGKTYLKKPFQSRGPPGFMGRVRKRQQVHVKQETRGKLVNYVSTWAIPY